MSSTKIVVGMMLFCLLATQTVGARVRLSGGHRQAVDSIDVKEDHRTGATKDDFHENSDVVRTSESYTSTNVTMDPDYQAKLNEEILGYTDTKTYEVYDEPQKMLVHDKDGKLTTQIVMVKVNKTAIVRTFNVSVTTKTVVNIQSVKEYVLALNEQIAPESSESDLALFNRIATTDGNKYSSNYNYVQVLAENLESTLRVSLDIMRVKMTEVDIADILQEIRECKNNVVQRVTKSDAIDVVRDNLWTVHAEFFVCACNAGAKGYQFFTYTSSKTGGWVDGINGKDNENLQSNFSVIKKIIQPWLWRWSGMLFTCKDVPTQTPAYGNVPTQEVAA